jgi:F-type H+-transporting ATPase subunit gamma
MSTLKTLRTRIDSVKSTQKMTSAMKMVAASKLKRAEESVRQGRPFADAWIDLMTRAADNWPLGEDHDFLHDLNPVRAKTWSDYTLSDTDTNYAWRSRTLHADDRLKPLPIHQENDPKAPTDIIDYSLSELIPNNKSLQDPEVRAPYFVVFTSDRGLCGGLNTTLIRHLSEHLKTINTSSFKIIVLGQKGATTLRRLYPNQVIETWPCVESESVAHNRAQSIIGRLYKGAIENCTLVYNRFDSVMAQRPVLEPLVPFKPADIKQSLLPDKADQAPQSVLPSSLYNFTPSIKDLFDPLCCAYIRHRFWMAALENHASEQGARMTAMDGATRNAGDMIGSLELTYNRTRQAAITKELIEIISGAEAL